MITGRAVPFLQPQGCMELISDQDTCFGEYNLLLKQKEKSTRFMKDLGFDTSKQVKRRGEKE